jgi:hypothetical protein
MELGRLAELIASWERSTDEFLGWSPETWTAIGTLALAGATLLVIVVALFEEPLRRYFSRAKLSMAIGKESPDTPSDRPHASSIRRAHRLGHLRPHSGASHKR